MHCHDIEISKCVNIICNFLSIFEIKYSQIELRPTTIHENSFDVTSKLSKIQIISLIKGPLIAVNRAESIGQIVRLVCVTCDPLHILCCVCHKCEVIIGKFQFWVRNSYLLI